MKRQDLEQLNKGLLLLLLLLFAAAAGPLFGQNKIYNLRAGTATRTMPDGQVVTFWGYALQSYDEGDGVLVGADNVVSIPGPRLFVAAGQGLTVNLVNELPEPVSILIPGQALPLATGAILPQTERAADGRIRSFVHETPADDGNPLTLPAPASYNWPDIAPGTYLYHSATHPAVQVQMGLYGALTKNAQEADPAALTKARAYPGTAYEYDSEILFLYSEVDPALHAAVASGVYGTGAPGAPQSTIDYHPKYFLVNGVLEDPAFDPATGAPLSDAAAVTTAGSATLLRILNAGLWDHAPQFLGPHLTMLAEDGKTYPYPRKQYSLLLTAGKTLDAILALPEAGVYPLFDRRLYRSQAATIQGTMQALIRAEPAPVAAAAP